MNENRHGTQIASSVPVLFGYKRIFVWIYHDLQQGYFEKYSAAMLFLVKYFVELFLKFGKMKWQKRF